MDDHTDAPASPNTLSRPLFTLTGPPLLIILAGLLMTAIAAQSLGQYAREHSKRMTEAQHSAIVNAAHAALASAPGPAGFDSGFVDQIPNQMSVRIDALEQHTNSTVFEVNTGKPRAQDHTLRSSLSQPSGQWLITSIPDRAVFEQSVRESAIVTWVSGTMLSLFGAFVCLMVGLRWFKQLQVSSAIRREQEAQNQHLSNLQTEKRILRKALNDSEQRSRDLVSLSGAIVCELDEQGKAGFVSTGVVDVLGFAPADLTDVEVNQLIADSDREIFDQTLNAARQTRQLQQAELNLTNAEHQRIPVTLRVLPLHDTLHGFSGFRLSMHPTPV
ncbi:PAS domain-containing protein [Marinobacter confluentis]|uniref:PAS domain S-box protein n=1 Tax=Marinobacter confluentis TaxID=1697557 RepID=A0A4Z1BNF4_9GAMM|nr:PAS domain-containing protein [Marinobacter confluentis]TGN38917.1 PAS domain S-box protein [Marinobacter confluentis]